MSVWEFCIRRPVFTTVLMIALIGIGVMGYTRMGVDLMPDFDVPVTSIVTTYVGADPEVIDQDITDVIEEQVGTIEGIDSITSTSYDSYSSIVVQFVLERNIDVATQEVRDKVAKAEEDLPDEIDKPLVQKVDPDAQAIMYMTLYGDADYSVLSDFADNVLKQRLQSIPGVGNVQYQGFRERNVRVWLNPLAMAKYDVGPAQVLNAINNWHVTLPGGRIESPTNELTIKMEGEYPTIRSLEELTVDYRDGAPIRLKELARVEDGLEDIRGVSRFCGKPCIMLGVCKQSGQNTIAIANTVRERLPELRRILPAGVQLVTIFDQSEFIENSVKGVGTDLLLGCGITAVIIYLFLCRFNMTIISLIAIPTSLLGAFGCMYFLGFTINQITMLAMSLAVGLVVDDTIVVMENIFRFVEESDDPVPKAAASGTSEVAFAVLAATMAICAIFLPVAFMGGVIGRVFYQFGISIGLAILFSYIVSVTITPMLCGRWIKRNAGNGFMSRLINGFMGWLSGIYRFFLNICIKNSFTRFVVFCVAIGVFAFTAFLATKVGNEFSPNADRSAFLIMIETPVGTSVYKTDERVRKVEDVVRAYYDKTEGREVKAYAGWVGSQSNQVNAGGVLVDMVPRSERKRSQQEVMDEIGAKLRGMPGVKCFPSHLQTMGGGSGRNSDLTFIIQGPELSVLQEITDKLMTQVKADPDFVDADDDLEITQPQVSVYPKRDSAADVQMDTRQIAVALQAMMGGVDVSKFKINGKRYDIRVKVDDQFRTKPDYIKDIILRTPTGSHVELGTIADVVDGVGPYSVKRYDRMRSVTIRSNVRAGLPTGNGGDKLEKMANNILKDYPGYSVKAAGMSKIQRESMGYLVFALCSSIVLIYFVLAAQFESFIHPFTIMMTVPLALFGVVSALYITGTYFSIFSLIGVIMLVGIVTRNGILLVEFANQKRAEGLSPVEAMKQAGPLRLRPILMTAISTIGGVIPVALGMSEGGEVRMGMGISVIGGMITSTFMTLLVIPVIYVIFEHISEFIGKIRNKLFGTTAEEEA